MNEDSIQYSGTPSLLGRSVIVINQEWCRGLKSSFILQPTRSTMTVGFAESHVAMVSHGRSSHVTSWSVDSLVCISRLYVYWKRLVHTNRVEIACLLSLFLRQDLLDPRMALSSLCGCRHASACVPSNSTSWVLGLQACTNSLVFLCWLGVERRTWCMVDKSLFMEPHSQTNHCLTDEWI